MVSSNFGIKLIKREPSCATHDRQLLALSDRPQIPAFDDKAGVAARKVSARQSTFII